jgi:hypothetical protein
MFTHPNNRAKGKLCCRLEDLLPAPLQTGYRNKVSMTIGLDKDHQHCIGFALGKTGQGITLVAVSGTNFILGVIDSFSGRAGLHHCLT